MCGLKYLKGAGKEGATIWLLTVDCSNIKKIPGAKYRTNLLTELTLYDQYFKARLQMLLQSCPVQLLKHAVLYFYLSVMVSL